MVNFMCDMVWYGPLHASTVCYGALCVWYGVVQCICWVLMYVRLHVWYDQLSVWRVVWYGILHVWYVVAW